MKDIDYLYTLLSHIKHFLDEWERCGLVFDDYDSYKERLASDIDKLKAKIAVLKMRLAKHKQNKRLD